MNRSAVTRRLAAILIADVVGFSRHMERDEAGAFARLQWIRERVIDPKIAEHGGQFNGRPKCAGFARRSWHSHDALSRSTWLRPQAAIDVMAARASTNSGKAFPLNVAFGDFRFLASFPYGKVCVPWPSGQ